MTGCRDCVQYKKRIETLEEELALVKFELEDLRLKRYKSKRKKPPGNNEPPMPLPKKKGGLFGHIGWFRRKPKNIHKIEEVKLTECPDCGSQDIKEYKNEVEEHTQEDIVLPKVETTLFRKHLYYCKKCQKAVRARGLNELSGSYIGPTAKSFAVFLKYGIKTSDRDIQCMFEKMFNLKIAPSSIVGFRDQLKREALPTYEALKESLKQGRFIHADETGWKIDGDNAWVWKFSNKKICVTHTDLSRGQKVVEDVLGDKYNGTLISDFLSAYNKISAKAKQRCLVHILRDLEKVIKYWRDDKEVIRYCTMLKKILEDSIGLAGEYRDKKRDKIYYRKRKLIVKRLHDFSFPNPNKRILQRFVKRLNRHKNEVFTFLYEKGVDFHNNHAEQQIRPDVIFRKITFGNRSLEGAKVHDVLMSILQTAKLNGMDPIETLRKLLLGNGKNPLSKVLAPP
ncbi:MAG: IS66 family transposase [Candidatus Omnitrophica bacterium]|nr:IS66 family transposase [Candidatus Omnitrophota bacterium]